MAGTTTAAKPRAARKPRATAQRAGRTAASTTTVVGPDAAEETPPPEVPGGAVDLVDGPAEVVTRDVLFRRNGVAYTIPTKFTASDTLRYVDLVAFQGSDVAIAWALRHALGDAGVVALMETKNLPDATLSRIVDVVHRRLTGMDVPKD